MNKVAFFDTKPYDKIYFDALKEQYGIEIEYFESRLSRRTAVMAKGSRAVVAFVNDIIDRAAIETLRDSGIELIALRCAGYNNVDLKAADGVMPVVRVPAYSPHAIAEHAMALLLTLVRKTHKAYIRTRDFNFSLNGFVGFDLHGKTVGVIGTGKIGMTFVDICRGMGMNVIAYDPYPAQGFLEYVPLDELFRRSDVISLHCPLTADTYHVINSRSLAVMKDRVFILNTSRGALIDSEALIEAIKSGKVKLGDYKTILQEIIQQNPEEHISYEVTEEEGEAHHKTFTADVMLNGQSIGTGSGQSKKEAEQAAAKEAIGLMGYETD